jgi:hypothetical protein
MKENVVVLREMPPGLTYADLQERLKGHRKAEASLVGR